MLIATSYAHCDVRLQTGELVCLGGHYADDVSLLALNTELSNRSCQVSLLVRSDCGADDQCAQTAEGEEQLGQRLVFEDELQRGSVNEYAILLILIKEVDQSVLTAKISGLAG